MNRRELTAAAGALALAPALLAAQPVPGRVYRIGVLSSAIEQPSVVVLSELKALGYEAGRNLEVDFRLVREGPAALDAAAKAMVAKNPDLIFAPLNPEIEALVKATRSIPIVMGFASLPVEVGIVKSLARPGGNVTGTTTTTADTAAKMIEVLHEALPQARRIRNFYDRDYSAMPIYRQAIDRAAAALGLRCDSVFVRTAADLDAALAGMERDRPDAAFFSITGILLTQAARLIDFCARQRLPAMYSINRVVRVGGLMSYSADFGELIRRQGTIVDRILRGARPSDIPVEEPSRFRLVVNAKTAKALGLSLPPGLALRVDEFVE